VKVKAVDTILYPGYEPTCTRLVTSVSGGRPPYRYKWTPSNLLTPEIEVCPTANTKYTVTVTDADGNTVSGEVTLTVIDVTCQKDKVTVCHNGKLLCISKEAVKSHLAHGDLLGSGNCKEEPRPIKTFKIMVMPNPFINTTNIRYEVPENGRVLIMFFDSQGRLLSIPVNSERKPGTYNLIFNAAHLNTGIYYYYGTFISKKEVQLEKGKMVKIR
jgi:hypothetical protein